MVRVLIDRDPSNEVLLDLIKSVTSQWANDMISTSSYPVVFYRSRGEYHGLYFSENAKALVSYCTLPHDEPYTGLCNRFEWGDETQYVSCGRKMYTLDALKKKISKHLKIMYDNFEVPTRDSLVYRVMKYM